MSDVPRDPDRPESPTVALVRRAKGGDDGARDALFAAAVPRLLTYVRLRSSERLRALTEPDDLVQDALVAALSAFAEFEPRGARAFGAWLCRIAEHQIRAAASHHGAQKRRPDGGLDRWSQIATRLVVVGTSPASAVAHGERLAQLEAAIAQLPADERDVVLAHHFQDLSLRELAAGTGIAVTTAHRVLGRATARLGRLLQAAAAAGRSA